jgi:signal transduction histidine kinase
MRLGIKGKQVVGVTSIVGVVVVALSVAHLARLARAGLEESQARAELIAKLVFHRAREVVAHGADPYAALHGDAGLHSILESSLYSKTVTFAAIVDPAGTIVAHDDPALEGQSLPPGGDMGQLLARPALSQLTAIYSGQGRNLELRQPLLLGDAEIGSLHIGVSTLLIRQDLDASLGPAVLTAGVALALSVIVASLFAQWLLRPIHVIRSGLTRLGQGEFGVRLDLDRQDEFGELGTFFNTMSAQLSADRTQMAGQVAHLESAVEHLEDAVAVVSPSGIVLFANPAMRVLLPEAAAGAELGDLVEPGHPLRALAERALATRQSQGPVSAIFPTGPSDRLADPTAHGAAHAGERSIMAHPVHAPHDGLLAVMLVARNVEYLGQVESTVRYSRKLAALGQLSAGVAHEVKNPLNAMMIHLELLRQQCLAQAAAPGAAPATSALAHVDVIAGEIRRLDEVVQGFLKFTRPEDLRLERVALQPLIDQVVHIAAPEAERHGITVTVECAGAPDASGDPAMLRQAFLNLALNACQAMPGGGTLAIRCAEAPGGRVQVSFADTGVGIPPEHLPRIFDLYFTTKPAGSGIGLSMVYRTVQMHDGEIEVESIPGAGTTFRVLLPRA